MTMDPDVYALRRCSGRIHLFYPPEGYERSDVREAREVRAQAVCNGCTIRPACLDDELDHARSAGDIHGFRAGLTEDQRRQLWRTRYPDRGERLLAGRWYYELVPA